MAAAPGRRRGRRRVEAAPLRCTHYDAFRFFTAPARPRNAVTPTREAAPDLEQGGCLHANMDLHPGLASIFEAAA